MLAPLTRCWPPGTPLGSAQYGAPPLAAAIAYEPPTIAKAWTTFLAHIPTILLIWVVTIVLTAIGFVASLALSALGVGLASSGGGGEAAASWAAVLGNLAQWPFTILSNLVGVLFVAVPAMHYASGEIIDTEAALRVLMHRPIRYLLAGVLFTVVAAFGFVLCLLPGLAVTLVMPVYVNKVFLTDNPSWRPFPPRSRRSMAHSRAGCSPVSSCWPGWWCWWCRSSPASWARWWRCRWPPSTSRTPPITGEC